MSKLEELQNALTEFVESFELVFRDDWEFTEAALKSGYHINGTFLTPNVDDEFNNWGNRGGLLMRYRALLKIMA